MTFLISFVVFSFLTALVPSIFLLPRLELKRRTQVFLTIALFAVSCRFLFNFVFAGSMFNPAWHPAVVFTWGVLDTTLSVFFFAQIPCYLFFRRLSVKWRRIVASALVVISAGITIIGSYECMKIPGVKEITLYYEDLPPAFDGYRIAQLSDLHCSQITPRSRFEKIVKRTNEAKPDLICLTGDYVDGWVSQIGYKLEPLSGFCAPDGVFASPGNHEYYWGWEEWRKFFTDCNIAVLENTWTNIVRGTDSLVVAGLADIAAFRARKCTADGEMAFESPDKYQHPDHVRTFSNVPKDSFRILLYHRPISTLLANRSCNVRLQLSGHTHGGAFPGLAGLVARCNERHVRGLYKEGKFNLYVSPGTGQWAGFPIRILNASEITLFTLKRAASK